MAEMKRNDDINTCSYLQWYLQLQKTEKTEKVRLLKVMEDRKKKENHSQ